MPTIGVAAVLLVMVKEVPTLKVLEPNQRVRIARRY